VRKISIEEKTSGPFLSYLLVYLYEFRDAESVDLSGLVLDLAEKDIHERPREETRT